MAILLSAFPGTSPGSRPHPPPGRRPRPGRGPHRGPAARPPALLLPLLWAAAAAGASAQEPAPEPADSSAPRAEAPLGREQLARRLEGLLADPALSRAHVGLHVQVAETGEVLFSTGAERRYTAASTAKLVTAATALRRLGPAFRWTTRLAATGTVEDSVLRGDLWVVGDGDPTLDREDLARWASALRAAGVRRVQGDVVGDGRAFPPPAWGRGWMWDDLHLAWAAGVSGLQMGDPDIEVALRPGDAPGEPALPGPVSPPVPLPVELQVRTGAPGSDVRLRYVPDDGPGPGGRLRGWIPADGDSVRLALAPRHPVRHLLRGLAGVFRDSSLAVDGRFRLPREGEPPPGDTPPWSAAFPSDSLGQVLADILQPSDNQAAESLLRTLGRVGEGRGTADAGLEVVEEALSEWGVPPDAVSLADGSGLSRYDAVTPAGLVRLLRAVWKSPHHASFLEALARPGGEGTLEARLLDTPARDGLAAKTGSLASVRALAGYVEDGAGQTLVFALFVDGYHVPGPVAEALRDLLVEQLSLHRRPVQPGWPEIRRRPGGEGGGTP